MLGFLKKVTSVFQRGDLPELPPPDFAKLPPGAGYKIQYFDSMDDLDRWARENHISASDAYNPRRFMGGVAPGIKVIGLPRPGLLRDQTLDDRLYSHEVGGHSNDLVHAPGGKGWGWQAPDGRFFPVASLADLRMAKAIYAPQPPVFDWGSAFAKGAPAKQAESAPPKGLLSLGQTGATMAKVQPAAPR